MHVILLGENPSSWRGLKGKSPFCRGVLGLLLGALVVLALAVCGDPACAADDLHRDNLHLTGIVKNINSATGMVYVEVVSSSCVGMRIFRADDIGKLESFLNQEISFFIDSATCKDNNVHTILVSWGIKKW
jgi:hypothetical protein